MSIFFSREKPVRMGFFPLQSKFTRHTRVSDGLKNKMIWYWIDLIIM